MEEENFMDTQRNISDDSLQQQEISMESNESFKYLPTGLTLDDLYKEQLRYLRELVLRTGTQDDIILCRKWLKVFGKTSKNEKMARNCLCALMQHQLEVNGYLEAPFMNLRNCNRNLEQVLRELDEENFERATGGLVEELSYANSQLNQARAAHKATIQRRIQDECVENEIKAENVELRRQLEELRIISTGRDIEVFRMREVTQNLQEENTKLATAYDDVKKALMNSAQKYLQDHSAESLNPFTVFESVFQCFKDDEVFITNARSCDIELQRMFDESFNHQLNVKKMAIAQEVFLKYEKAKTKLRKKYERRLSVQTWAHRLQLKLVKLKCFSALRKIFISIQNKGSGDNDLWAMLKTLEEKYQTVVNEIF